MSTSMARGTHPTLTLSLNLNLTLNIPLTLPLTLTRRAALAQARARPAQGQPRLARLARHRLHRARGVGEGLTVTCDKLSS